MKPSAIPKPDCMCVLDEPTEECERRIQEIVCRAYWLAVIWMLFVTLAFMVLMVVR